MDYLVRDSLHAGVPYGRNFDQQRLIGSLCVNAAGDGLMPHGFVMRKPFAAPTLYAAVNQAVLRARGDSVYPAEPSLAGSPVR